MVGFRKERSTQPTYTLLRRITLKKGSVLYIKEAQYEIEILDDQIYTPGSVDNIRQYSKEYLLDDSRNTSQHGVICKISGSSPYSCILFAGGGGTTIHEHSAIVLGNNLYIAVGDRLCCLRLPSLDLLWYPAVDEATCFGVYYSLENRCLISHGELTIARVNFEGEIEWSASGKDIFSEGFSLFPDHIEVIDFNHEKYWVEISSGKTVLVGNE